jgi:hypothetical protein
MKVVLVGVGSYSFNLTQEAFCWLISNKGWKVTKPGSDGVPTGVSNKLELWGEIGGNLIDFCDDYYEDPNLTWEENEARKTLAIQTDPDIVEVVETLGERAGKNLKVIEIPDNVDFTIEDYDGAQWVAEKHRTWS